MSNKPKKRFIAGAVCPRCGAMDRLVMTLADHNRRECVDCGFSDALETDTTAQELVTRVNQTPEPLPEGVQVLNLVDPGKKTRH